MKRILDKWRGYSVEDCSCIYCLFYGGHKNGEINCLADECICKNELKEAALRERNKIGSKDK